MNAGLIITILNNLFIIWTSIKPKKW